MRTMVIVIVVLLCSNLVEAQELERQGNGQLQIDLTETRMSAVNCPLESEVEVSLFEKINEDEEKTCSRKNSWDKINSFLLPKKERLLLSKREKGIYKAQIVVSYSCAEGGRSISQVFETNVLNDFEVVSEKRIDWPSHALQVFPNPSLEKFIVKIEKSDYVISQDYSLQVFSSEGKMVLEKMIPSSESHHCEIDLAGFPAGQYTFSVSQDGVQIGTSQVFKISE